MALDAQLVGMTAQQPEAARARLTSQCANRVAPIKKDGIAILVIVPMPLSKFGGPWWLLLLLEDP